MSSPSQYNWTVAALAVAVGALIFHGMTRGPGTCPANAPARPGSEAGEIAATDASGDAIPHADEQSFERLVLESDEPVLVDFHADWCGPCRQLAPVLDRVAVDTPEGRIVKVNVDHNANLVARYGIRTIPTLLLFVNGEVVTRIKGARTEHELRQLLEGGRG